MCSFTRLLDRVSYHGSMRPVSESTTVTLTLWTLGLRVGATLAKRAAPTPFPGASGSNKGRTWEATFIVSISTCEYGLWHKKRGGVDSGH